MKLYTEEQACKIIQKTIMDKPETYDEVLRCYTPIELPSDEEIRMQTQFAVDGFYWGAKWMREKILNQNKDK